MGVEWGGGTRSRPVQLPMWKKRTVGKALSAQQFTVEEKAYENEQLQRVRQKREV